MAQDSDKDRDSIPLLNLQVSLLPGHLDSS